MIDSQGASHGRFEADLAELAAGVLDRGEEEALLNHLGSCPSCAAEFEQLAWAAKSLLLMVVDIEPPIGFESRFWDRIDSGSFDNGSR
jgi:hypothetical protein